jgi:hypothetical protein
MTLKQTLNNIHISKTNYFNSNVLKNSNKSIFDSIISVTPLSAPSGQLFYFDFIYDNTTNT